MCGLSTAHYVISLKIVWACYKKPVHSKTKSSFIVIGTWPFVVWYVGLVIWFFNSRMDWDQPQTHTYRGTNWFYFQLPATTKHVDQGYPWIKGVAVCLPEEDQRSQQAGLCHLTTFLILICIAIINFCVRDLIAMFVWIVFHDVKCVLSKVYFCASHLVTCVN